MRCRRQSARNVDVKKVLKPQVFIDADLLLSVLSLPRNGALHIKKIKSKKAPPLMRVLF